MPDSVRARRAMRLADEYAHAMTRAACACFQVASRKQDAFLDAREQEQAARRKLRALLRAMEGEHNE